MCASSPAVISVRSWSSVGWVEPRGPTREVGCWNGGGRIRRRHLRLGRAPAPARRSGRVGSRRDPSDGQVTFVVGFSIPLPRRGAGAFIVSVVGPSYLITLLPLRLTMSSYLSTMPLVLAVRRASADRVLWDYSVVAKELARLRRCRLHKLVHVSRERGRLTGVDLASREFAPRKVNITLGLTSAVTSGVTASYGESVGAKTWRAMRHLWRATMVWLAHCPTGST
ncbi:hypothetical protein BHE74_00024934 [Ensete ventricosum]|nr:hypothetical protein BHE74_00024934 [Ensete ventricosum]